MVVLLPKEPPAVEQLGVNLLEVRLEVRLEEPKDFVRVVLPILIVRLTCTVVMNWFVKSVLR